MNILGNPVWQAQVARQTTTDARAYYRPIRRVQEAAGSHIGMYFRIAMQNSPGALPALEDHRLPGCADELVRAILESHSIAKRRKAGEHSLARWRHREK